MGMPFLVDTQMPSLRKGAVTTDSGRLFHAFSTRVLKLFALSVSLDLCLKSFENIP